ncbi:hypothetical protein, conserved [Trypanosoma brucei brucei TREU927]|uniref:Uncharacterized protein n=1 Tax=Trypanosoma brucei brucei (strain 927/4 GUTat10.1) TaxID=185431 RepID=Q4GYB9_TRYB2|nr:hypothetical protein, conserved [Trypanosoma brucei brucei TREU927]XP_001219152.1 hypothetical protein, conserved [Trypanosoma brucei brucei TREU927]CAJ16661.1 hypothetical protein, conserved [Trypanosoma brucei brucei TREU927]CAJ16665.1 hypothetical protein, conserved [Trypanosoma brucei brucei TREU927]
MFVFICRDFVSFFPFLSLFIPFFLFLLFHFECPYVSKCFLLIEDCPWQFLSYHFIFLSLVLFVLYHFSFRFILYHFSFRFILYHFSFRFIYYFILLSFHLLFYFTFVSIFVSAAHTHTHTHPALPVA